MSRVLKSILLIINLILLAACGAITPEPESTATATGAPSLTPVSPTSTPTQTATRTSSTTVPASTSTPALLTSSATPQPDPVEQTQEAQAFCYQDPRKALDDFLSYLYHGEYKKAARLYGSTYPFERRLISPEDMDPIERLTISAKFLEEFCLSYGTCLKHRIVNEEILSEQEVIFEVEFFNENGEILEIVIPEIDSKGFATEVTYTKFRLKVVRLDNCYKSMRHPPMTP